MHLFLLSTTMCMKVLMFLRHDTSVRFLFLATGDQHLTKARHLTSQEDSLGQVLSNATIPITLTSVYAKQLAFEDCARWKNEHSFSSLNAYGTFPRLWKLYGVRFFLKGRRTISFSVKRTPSEKGIEHVCQTNSPSLIHANYISPFLSLQTPFPQCRQPFLTFLTLYTLLPATSHHETRQRSSV